MRNAEITFTPERPADAAALIADLEHVGGRKERRGHSHVLNLQPTPERKGLFRRAEPVPSAAVFRSERWFSVVVGTLDVMQVGSLSSDLAANGFTAPSHWELGADVSNNGRLAGPVRRAARAARLDRARRPAGAARRHRPRRDLRRRARAPAARLDLQPVGPSYPRGP